MSKPSSYSSRGVIPREPTPVGQSMTIAEVLEALPGARLLLVDHFLYEYQFYEYDFNSLRKFIL